MAQIYFQNGLPGPKAISFKEALTQVVEAWCQRDRRHNSKQRLARELEISPSLLSRYMGESHAERMPADMVRDVCLITSDWALLHWFTRRSA